jgi:hypothetical protein
VSDDDCCDPVFLDGPDAAAAAGRLGVLGFVALWRGQRPAVASLCDDSTVVEAQKHAGRLEVDDAGLLVGVHGLVARTTRHRIDHAAGAVHTWCALDAIGIPAALAIDATAVTSCPTCDVELRVELCQGEPVDTEEPLRLWLPEGICDHLVEDFCDHANLYCSPEHLSATVPKGSPGRIATVADAVAIGRQTWDDAAAALGDEGSGVHDGRWPDRDARAWRVLVLRGAVRERPPGPPRLPRRGGPLGRLRRLSR